MSKEGDIVCWNHMILVYDIDVGGKIIRQPLWFKHEQSYHFKSRDNTRKEISYPIAYWRIKKLK